tara:strand:+ start:333 stop:578 length:246 start_codon:yes stop_codon:yes gene_type:complete
MSKKKKKLSKKAQDLNDKIVQLSKTTKTRPKQIKSSDTFQFVNINNKQEVAELFKERTDIKYQNWIQALMVTMEKSDVTID